jgi:HSP20 family protein
MNLIKFNKPVRRNALGHVLDDFFNRSLTDFVNDDFSITSPATNIIQNEDAFVIELAAPGLKKEDFDIKVDKDLLTITSESSTETSEHDEKTNYSKREFNYSSFSKSFHLPESIDADNIAANYDNGVLKLTLKVREEAKVKEPKKIEIK